MLKPLVSHTAQLVLDEAIHAELRVSHLYKHVANQLQRIGYFGAAKHFRNESAEELQHYQKIADYLNDRGSIATLPAIEEFVKPVADLEAALSQAYSEEVSLGNKYSTWYSTLLASDPITAQFLIQFLEIQRVSAGAYGDWLSRVALAKGDTAALLLIDKELGD